MTMLKDIIGKVMANEAVKDKIQISRTHQNIGKKAVLGNSEVYAGGRQHDIAIGDDCAAIPDGNGGYLLFAAEGMVSSFAKASPWFAGYSAVMVNISDVCAMGGLPLAVTDVLWVENEEDGDQIWAGMLAASNAYGVPIVGGHTCYRSRDKNLAVAILGKANKLLSSFNASPGETLMLAVDLNGSYFESYPFWNASTTSSSAHLRQLVGLMHELAERGLSSVAKDISMGGIVGTLAMLTQSSEVGANIKLTSIPRPEGVPWEKWLVSFPSFGYLFTCSPVDIEKIQQLFNDSKVSCEPIGIIAEERDIIVSYENDEIKIPLN